MEAVDTLVKYGQSYQSKVVASLISDVKFLEQVSEITKPAFFESEANKWIINEVIDYFGEYRAQQWRFLKSKLVQLRIKD